ncbi:hypothetical protein CP533_4749 [Ophiocordyceps camponoti-saundersi (nom. inval.)]|nr:hypothetical protein CP533_4749 [Ophiocordyceps camponoti-saundersi (nom. inval.)]
MPQLHESSLIFVEVTSRLERPGDQKKPMAFDSGESNIFHLRLRTGGGSLLDTTAKTLSIPVSPPGELRQDEAMPKMGQNKIVTAGGVRGGGNGERV